MVIFSCIKWEIFQASMTTWGSCIILITRLKHRNWKTNMKINKFWNQECCRTNDKWLKNRTVTVCVLDREIYWRKVQFQIAMLEEQLCAQSLWGATRRIITRKLRKLGPNFGTLICCWHWCYGDFLQKTYPCWIVDPALTQSITCRGSWWSAS